MIVFLSCVKSKANKPCEAQDMYTSDLFRKSLAYAKLLKPRKIYILSALYGVLELDDTIQPYNKTLVNAAETERKRWALMAYKQMLAKGIDFNEQVVFLTGYEYRKYLINKFKNADAPLSRLGIGEQLAFYKRWLKS